MPSRLSDAGSACTEKSQTEPIRYVGTTAGRKFHLVETELLNRPTFAATANPERHPPNNAERLEGTTLDDLISRTALLEWLAPFAELEKVGMPQVIEVIQSRPTIEAAPVVHGKWEQIHYEGGILDGTNADKCTVCGFERVVETESFKTNYLHCPNCGAKMNIN